MDARTTSYFVTHCSSRRRIIQVLETANDEIGYGLHLGFLHAPRRHTRCADSEAARYHRSFLVERNHILVRHNPDFIAAAIALR